VDSANATLTTIANPGTVITITGVPSLVTQSSSSYTWTAASGTNQRGQLNRSATTGSQTGSFTYTTSDGRSGTCSVNLTTNFDPETRVQTVKGTFCGKEVKAKRKGRPSRPPLSLPAERWEPSPARRRREAGQLVLHGQVGEVPELDVGGAPVAHRQEPAVLDPVAPQLIVLEP
jgi:hypothetical protein